uniref:Uncharacterized protein n=1 Tax=Arundo donax TaxID=35708 RepID=A0A0A8Z873_ARUDO
MAARQGVGAQLCPRSRAWCPCRLHCAERPRPLCGYTRSQANQHILMNGMKNTYTC